MFQLRIEIQVQARKYVGYFGITCLNISADINCKNLSPTSPVVS